MAAAATDEGEILRIMLASDVHLGINERDPLRKDDAKVIIEEIFQIANEKYIEKLRDFVEKEVEKQFHTEFQIEIARQ